MWWNVSFEKPRDWKQPSWWRNWLLQKVKIITVDNAIFRAGWHLSYFGFRQYLVWGTIAHGLYLLHICFAPRLKRTVLPSSRLLYLLAPSPVFKHTNSIYTTNWLIYKDGKSPAYNLWLKFSGSLGKLNGKISKHWWHFSHRLEILINC